MEDSDKKTISLLIKTPNQAQEDRNIEGVEVNWTVGELKNHLSTVYPTKPAVSEQRLIFAGKLLPDHLHIKDLFRQTDSIPTLHLVCAARSPTQTAPTTSDQQRAPPAPAMPDVRQRRPTMPPGFAQTPAAAFPAFPTYSLYSPQQLLWLQHVYARQYYMQYHAALAAAHSAPSSPAATVAQHPPVPAHQLPVPMANQDPAQEAGFLNGGEAEQNLRMNAQGGPVMGDEEDAERDWLDWLYSAARCGVLLMIIYFNSSLSRFLLVMSTLLVMYLHTAGMFPFRRRVQEPEAQHNRQNENRNAADEPADAETAAILVPPHRISVFWTAWVFFKSFFSSLIPEVQQAN